MLQTTATSGDKNVLVFLTEKQVQKEKKSWPMPPQQITYYNDLKRK